MDQHAGMVADPRTRLTSGDGLKVSHLTGLYLIAAVSGLVDAACFLGLGHVFAEMMTGNILLFCIFLGTGDHIFWHGGYLLALGSFAVGAVLGGRIFRGARGRTRLGFLVEWVLLAVAVALSMTLPLKSDPLAAMYVLAPLAFAFGLQNALVRKHGVPDLATNVMTLTFAAYMSDTRLAGGHNENWPRRVGSIGLFMVGATLGALLTKSAGPWAALMMGLIVYSVALTGLTRQSTPA
ncbi:MAG TPA: YoaK family protein [Stellaceae bacterium]